MPTYNMVPKDKKSSRRPEVRRSNVVIYVLPLILCFLASVAIWCYTAGMNRPGEPELSPPIVDTSPPMEAETAADGQEEDTAPAEDDTQDPASGDVETLPVESEAQPSDV